ncbi:glutathione S-transferase P 1 [Aplysia californica]|uniref:glutathione transferase n=1 Tax=Aplysia californica TaxID=6500 RepID=A0ABM0JQU7_APLCA|nr:glutathione S-transferase P 1 [Aplysia californica]
MGKYQLIYFNVRGRGEATRYLFKDNGIDYDEVNCRENWAKEWKSQMAFGQTPCLKDNDLSLVQSNAILRYLGRKHGLYGSNEEEAAYIDMITEGIEDLRVKYVTMIYKNYENGKEPYVADLPKQLLPFEKLVTKHGDDKSGFSVGNKRSFVDYALFDLLDINVVLAPNCLDDFPALSAFYKAILNRPGIAAYRETEAFKERTINGNGKQ